MTTNQRSPVPSRDTDPESAPYPQGYDYEFVIPLDPQFECTICLLCQRDPYQTTCGHRFCKECLLRWLRNEEPRCPHDNTPLTESKIFPDNFAKREIFNLMAKCPNKTNGCKRIQEVGQIDEHLQTCEYVQVPCPNRCSTLLVLKKDFLKHINEDCPARTVNCPQCFEQFTQSRQQEHRLRCPMLTVTCEYCGDSSLLRQELLTHQSAECQKITVPCLFSNMGCNEKVPREHLDKHMSSSVQEHLHLVATSYTRLSSFVYNMMQSLEKFGKSPPTSYSSSVLSLGQLGLDNSSLFPPHSDVHKSLSLPLSGEPAEEAALSSSESLGDLTRRKLVVSEEPAPDLSSLDSNQRSAYLERTVHEQKKLIDSLQLRLFENERAIAGLVGKMNHMQARVSNGVYYWKIHPFSHMIKDAYKGKVVHSPGFYTSPQGYKVCLRINVVSNEKDIRFSVFIHLMKGEYDDFLSWPFEGTIKITILDQTEREEKKHISETMTTKPGLDAFKRPTNDRNPKGFGYLEFVSLNTLLQRDYIKDDQVLLHAVVSSSS